jgi:hypothetical protein
MKLMLIILVASLSLIEGTHRKGNTIVYNKNSFKKTSRFVHV